ncbi:MAG: RDD family protein [Gammaproteobacteria bacterium]|nr:RDD family protein [Gammaproteobacteria bacterium]
MVFEAQRQIEYAGFWRRLLGFSLDTLMVSVLTSAITLTLFGPAYLMQAEQGSGLLTSDWRVTALEQLLPAIWAVGFWLLFMATPGKLLMDCQIVDAKSHGRARSSQLIIRYLAYILSALPLGLGFLWILFDRRKQGWHDKLAGTVVMMQDASLHKLETYVR